MKNKPRWLQIFVLLAAVLLMALSRGGVLPFDADAPKDASPAYSQSQEDDGQLHWGNPNTLQDHFDRHGADFNAKNPEDYARQARVFFLEREQSQVKTDIDGTIRVYRAETNAFGAYSAEGDTKTYFKPRDGQAYFDRQPGQSHKGGGG
jgi:hypothetical protein